MPKTAAAKREWFKITNVAEQNKAKILLYGYIGASNKPRYDYWSDAMTDGEAGTVREFQQQLDAIPAAMPLDVFIASEGGNAWDALAMHNMLARREGPVNVIIDGFAFSSATLIAMAGDTIQMPQNALLMIHEASWVAIGTKSAMQAAFQSLETMDAAIAKSYAAKSGGKAEDFLELMKAETWMDGDEAKRLGLVDVVTASQSITAHFDLGQFEKMPTNFRARFDTSNNPNPQTPPNPQNSNKPSVMLRPRTPLFQAATDNPAAGGGAPTAAAPAAAPTANAPAPVVTPPAAAPAAAAPVVAPTAAAAPAAAAPAAPLTLADITAAVTNAITPLQQQIASQATEITNLQRLQNAGVPAATQGAPAITNAQPTPETGTPKAAAGDTPRERTVNALKSLPVFGTK